ncbi:MAG: glycosyltransferase family 4 protein [Thiolinea sp.]
MKKLDGVIIAQISTVPFFINTQLKLQLLTMASCGAIIHIITSDGSEINDLKNLHNNIFIHVVEIKRHVSILSDIRALIKIIKIFNSEKFNIIHSTTPKAGLISALAGYFSKIGIRIHTFTGQPWVNSTGFKRFLLKKIDQLIISLNTNCYTDSASQREFLINQKIAKKNSIMVIGDGSLAGVDINRFNVINFSCSDKKALRSLLGISKNDIVFIFIGRINLEKGVIELLEAFRESQKKYNHIHLIFVGPFEQKNIFLKEKIKLTPHTHIIEYTKTPENYLSIAHVLCLPSYREGFGTVIIEAAAMGIPTIGTNIYGISDAVKNKETGFLVNLKEPKSLESALNAFIMDDMLREKMGAAAKKRCDQLFSSEVVNAKVIDEYVKLLKMRNEK